MSVATRCGTPGPAPRWAEDPHALGALCGLAVLLAAWGYPLWGSAWEVLCPLRELTGIPCPTCFGTRALVAAAAGHWMPALRLNPLIGAGGIGLLLYVPWAGATVVGGWRRPRLPAAVIARGVRLACFLALANWIYLLAAHV